MKRFLATFLIISLVAAFSVIPAEAKDLSRRIGVGFTTQAGQILRPALTLADIEIPVLPSISAKYAMTEKIALGGFLGYRSGEVEDYLEVSIFSFGAKVYYNLVQEDNVNIYAGGGLNYSKGEMDNGTEVEVSGTEVFACLGGEFFFQGLPNLGFSLELGLDILASGEIEDGPDISGFGTYGDIFGGIGVHYYF